MMKIAKRFSDHKDRNGVRTVVRKSKIFVITKGAARLSDDSEVVWKTFGLP